MIRRAKRSFELKTISFTWQIWFRRSCRFSSAAVWEALGLRAASNSLSRLFESSSKKLFTLAPEWFVPVLLGSESPLLYGLSIDKLCLDLTGLSRSKVSVFRAYFLGELAASAWRSAS